MKNLTRVGVVFLAAMMAALLTGCGQSGPVKLATALTDATMPLPIQKDKSVAPSKTIPSDFAESPAIEFYGNFNTAGVLFEMPQTIPAEKVGNVRLFLNINGQWTQQHDMVQTMAPTAPMTWVGSLFWLQPNSTYQVKVAVYDRQGGELLASGCRSGQTRIEPSIADTPRKLYIAMNGDDANPGTSAKPQKTFAKAFSTATAGTTIYVRGGVYYEGDLQFAHSGRPGEPIVVRSYPGETAILDGSNPSLSEAGAWKDEGNNIYSTAFQGKCYNMILENRKTGQCRRALPLRTVAEVRNRAFDLARLGQSFKDVAPALDKNGVDFAFATDGTTAVCALPAPITDYKIHIARSTMGLRLEKKNSILFDGLEIRYFGKDDYSTAVMLLDSSDILFQNCRFMFDDTQVWVKGTCDHLTVQDCLFKDDTMNFPFGILKNDGALASFEAGAINVDANFSGRGMVIRRNTIDGLFDGAHLTPWIVDTARSNEVDFYQNRVLSCLDDFMELDGFARNVRVFENYMRRSLSGISVAQALDGPTFAIYNVIGDCGLVQSTIREGNWSYPFKTNGGPHAEDIGSGPMFFYHNTAYTTDPDSHAMLVKRPKWKSLVLKNNIWAGQKLGFEIWLRQPSPMDWDYDDLYVANPAGPLMLIDYKIVLKSLAEITAKYGYMKNGISADPMINDPAGGNYELKDQSPCIDKGVLIPGINDLRKRGAAPDIGAYERR